MGIFIISMFLYIGGYQFGFGPVSWLLVSEDFPLEIRGEGIALATQINFFWNLVVSMLFSDEIDFLGETWTFGVFTVITFVSIVFIFSLVPETRGLELEDIEDMLDSGTFLPEICCGGRCPVKLSDDETDHTNWRHD